MSRCVLFFDVSEHHLPLIRAVAERGFTPVVPSPLGPALQGGRGPVHLFESFAPAGLGELLQRETGRLREGLARALEAPEVLGAFASPRGEFLPRTGEGFFAQLLSILAHEMVVLETFEELARRLPLGLVVLGCDNSPVERVIVSAASRRGLPTLQLAHAIYTRPLARIAAEHKLYSDRVAVFGERARRIMVEYGIDPERITATGAPAWDPFYRTEARLSQAEARRRLSLEPEGPVVLYCSAYVDGSSAFYPALSRRLMEVQRGLVRAVSGIAEGARLLVRPHPNELGRLGLPAPEVERLDQAYLGILSEAGLQGARILRTHKVEAIRASDLVVAVGSSSIIPEAMILGRPVVVAPWLEEERLLYTEEDGVRVARGEAELAEAVSTLTADEACRREMVRRQAEVLPELNLGNDGRATGRVAELVESLAAQASRERPGPRRRRASREGALELILAAHNFLPYGLGGTERYTRDLALEMTGRGHRVRVLYPRYVGDDPTQCSLREASYQGLPVVEVVTSKNAFGLVRNEALKPVLRRYLEEQPADLVHAQHLMGLTVSFVEVLEELGVPFVFTANDFWPLCQQIHLVDPSGGVCTGPETMDKCVGCLGSRLGGAGEESLPRLFHYMAERYYTQKRAVGRMELVLCPSKFLMETFLRFGFEGRQTLHAPQGANLFEPLERPPRAVPPVVFSCLGTVDYRKGTDLAVEAFNLIEAADAELRLFGNVADQGYFERVMAAVRPGKAVTYHGEYSAGDLPGILASTDVAVVPSRGENYPFVIREILNARVPVIASKVAGIPEIVKEGRNGLLFEANDARDLADRMEAVIGDPGLIERLREGIEPVKSIPEDADEIERHYRRLLGRRSEGPPAAVVIVTYNSASTIRTCLDTVLESSQAPPEVVVVDNASGDATRSILAEYEGRITTILNDENLGFSRACNQGILASGEGEFVVLLNPDTAVPPGWIERMAAHLAPDVGAVGPVSSCVVGAQLVNRFMPEGRQGSFGLAELAALLAESNRGRSEEAKLLIGFCMMLSRRALKQVGLLDEDLFLGNDDLDISWRLRQAGWRLLIATDVFVYHEGQVSFRADEPSVTSALVQESTDRLYEKLEAHYGAGAVPDPMELWGIDWFRPTRLTSPSGQAGAGRPLTSIIILTHNQLEHTRLCLASIEAWTPEPHELIIVDNGSSDGTVEFLRSYAAERDHVRVVANSSNRGFAAGNNHGLALARGGFALLLNNDTVVTRGWLGRMMAVMERCGKAGVVGPVSNYVSGPQLVAEASYGSQAEMEAFADRWAEAHAGQSEPTLRVVGFCLLARREVVEAIGGLDERFGSGNFEDDDFCIRAARAGYEARIARDVFIHHAGSQTFKGAKIDYRRAMERNWELFKAKWGIPASSPMEGTYHLPPAPPAEAYSYVELPDLEAGHRPELEGRWWQEDEAAEGRGPRVSIGFVREGPDLAEARRAVLRFSPEAAPLTVWAEAAAINEELGRADYVVLLAPDVVVTKPWLETLLEVAAQEESIAATGPTSNAAPGPQAVRAGYASLKKALQKFASKRARRLGSAWEEVPYLGGFCLLLQSEAVRSAGGLSEGLPLADALWELFGRLRAEGLKLACALGAYVHHAELTDDEGARYDDVASVERSAARALEEAQAALERGDLGSAAGLLEAVTRQAPDLAPAHWAFGSTLVALEKLDEGVEALRRACELAPREASLRNQLGVALYELGEAEEAERAFVAALGEAPEDLDVLLNLVELYRGQERYGEAAEHLRRAQRLAPVDGGVLSALGAISIELGDTETALKALAHLQAVEPAHPEIGPLRQALGA